MPRPRADRRRAARGSGEDGKSGAAAKAPGGRPSFKLCSAGNFAESSSHKAGYVNLATPGFSKMPGERQARRLAASPPTAPGGRAGDGTYLARRTAGIGLGEQVMTTKTLRRRFFSLTGRVTRKARRLILHLPQGWPWQNQFSSALARLRVLTLPS